MRSVTLVSDGIVQSRIDNNGGKQKSEGGQTSGKLHNDWEVDMCLEMSGQLNERLAGVKCKGRGLCRAVRSGRNEKAGYSNELLSNLPLVLPDEPVTSTSN